MTEYDLTTLHRNPDAEVNAIRLDPASPTWVRKLIPELVERDIVDVTTVLEHLAGAFRRRYEAAVGGVQAPTIEPDAAQPLIDAQKAVATACLENRGAIERAVHLDESEDVFGDESGSVSVELREILDALDDWHTASMAVMQTADGLTTAHVDALALNQGGA